MSNHDDLSDPDVETLALVQRSLPRVTPPDDLFARILAEAKPQAAVIPLGRGRAGACSFRSRRA